MSVAGSNVNRVVVDLPLHQLTEGELRFLIDLFGDAERHGSRGWQRVFATFSEGLRAESARRQIEAAEHRDPMGHFWFGRL